MRTANDGMAGSVDDDVMRQSAVTVHAHETRVQAAMQRDGFSEEARRINTVFYEYVILLEMAWLAITLAMMTGAARTFEEITSFS